MATISENNIIAQSEYLYMQGAGSDGNDGSAQGVHLRWDFVGTLAEKHIPKGNLAAPGSEYYTTAGFNKANDFVKIYRTSYNHNFPVIIDFTTMEPTRIDNNACVWHYENIAPIPQLPDNTCNVLIRFYNETVYRSVKQQYNPASDRLNFLQHYPDIIEVEIEGRLLFSAYVQMQKIDNTLSSLTRIESISNSNDGENELFISSRKKYQDETSYLQKEDFDFLLQENDGYLLLDDSTVNGKILAENIQYIRFKGDNCFPTLLWLETYHDFLLGKNCLSEWQLLTELSLSIDTAEVFNRLENSNYPIDNRWTKYKNGATVNVANYKNKWYDNTNEDLRSGVIDYLTLSKSPYNLEAFAHGTSTLSMLKLIAFDFHDARMLGFGYIDAYISNVADKYMYIAVYETNAALDTLPAGLRTHTYMTLPVGKQDCKLPLTPTLLDLEYGLRMPQHTALPIMLTDTNGYSPYADCRYIGLQVAPFNPMRGMGGFFQPDEEYSYVDYTAPFLYGISYKKSNEPDWRTPEISNDPNFQDHANNNETVPCMRSEGSLNVYTHMETEEGVHDYAVYGINWFSRVSPLSNIKQTDITEFPTRNRLIPPLNVQAQLIQKEKTLMLTTRAEQQRLQNITTPDKTLLRVTFEWNDVHASNHWYGKEAEFFFRTTPPKTVKGRIKSVQDKGMGIYELHTVPYTTHSIQQFHDSLVPAGKERCFENSSLTIKNGAAYLVQSVEQSTITGEGSIFIVKSPEERIVTDTGNLDTYGVTNAPIEPQANNEFSVSENVSFSEAWDFQLTQKVLLTKFSDYSEPYTDSERNTTDIHIGGIYEPAHISELLDVDEQGQEIPNSKTGIYRIAFNNYTLTPHSNSNVEYYKGTVRIKVGNEMRPLDVWNIENTSPVQLIAHDGTFSVDENYFPTLEYTPIPTNTTVNVNFHPGYRMYFTAEGNFNQTTVLPAPRTESKQTYIACRSTDVVEGRSIASPLSTPAIITALEIIEPVAPEKPIGPIFASRPNFYGKSTYTFDTEVSTGNGREPYALVFYKANEQIILDALYKPSTVQQIRNDLAQIENDTAFSSRWNELVNVITDETTKQFKEWNGYRFPNPDNNEFKIKTPRAVFSCPFSVLNNPGNETIIVPNTEIIFGEAKNYKEVLQFAINNVFLSLTEQPVMYRNIKEGIQTRNTKPVLRDSNGELLLQEDVKYDASPMAVEYKTNGKSIVRFTDYTLDGASNSFFFFYAIEMNNKLEVSERSEILGPIQLINAAPPKAPEIKSFYARTEDVIMDETPAVLFEINEYSESEGVTKFLIYRAFDAKNAAYVQTMQLVKTVDSNEQIIDDFSDLSTYPFGEVLYYRIVAVRTVKTDLIEEEYQTEDVPSYPSSLILANIVDVNNPPAPELFYNENENKLTWETATYNGIYRLYQMNDSGNWVELYQENPKNASQYEFAGSLPKIDEDGETIYYRFKIVVENTAGLLSLEENVLQI